MLIYYRCHADCCTLSESDSREPSPLPGDTSCEHMLSSQPSLGFDSGCASPLLAPAITPAYLEHERWQRGTCLGAGARARAWEWMDLGSAFCGVVKEVGASIGGAKIVSLDHSVVCHPLSPLVMPCHPLVELQFTSPALQVLIPGKVVGSKRAALIRSVEHEASVLKGCVAS